MEGPSLEEEESRGMIARAVLQIFNNTHDLEAKGWQVQIYFVSFNLCKNQLFLAHYILNPWVDFNLCDKMS